MKFITLVAALAAVVPAVLGSLTINTPSNVVVCQPTQFDWSGGTGPYYLTLTPAGQPTATPVESFPEQSGTSYTWTVDLAAGVSVTAVLKDSTGAQAFSDIITVIAGSSTDCLNSGTAASTAAGTSVAAGTTAATGSGSSATTTSSSSTSTSSSAAGRLSVSSAFGVAGAMGLVGAALF